MRTSFCGLIWKVGKNERANKRSGTEFLRTREGDQEKIEKIEKKTRPPIRFFLPVLGVTLRFRAEKRNKQHQKMKRSHLFPPVHCDCLDLPSDIHCLVIDNIPNKKKGRRCCGPCHSYRGEVQVIHYSSCTFLPSFDFFFFAIPRIAYFPVTETFTYFWFGPRKETKEEKERVRIVRFRMPRLPHTNMNSHGISPFLESWLPPVHLAPF